MSKLVLGAFIATIAILWIATVPNRCPAGAATTAAGFFIFRGRLTDQEICRMLVCGVEGEGCRCEGSQPHRYLDAPCHAAFGGPLHCGLPACDEKLGLAATSHGELTVLRRTGGRRE